jgi:hypothetical protein
MSTTRTAGGFPFPNPDEPLANMDLAIKALAAAADPHACVMLRNAAQVIPNGAYTNVVWDAEESDVYNQGAAGQPGITLSEGGVYVISANIGLAINATGLRGLRILSGATQLGFTQLPAQSVSSEPLSLTIHAGLPAGSVLTAQLYQNSGVAGGLASTGGRFSASRVAPFF